MGELMMKRLVNFREKDLEIVSACKKSLEFIEGCIERNDVTTNIRRQCVLQSCKNVIGGIEIIQNILNGERD